MSEVESGGDLLGGRSFHEHLETGLLHVTGSAVSGHLQFILNTLDEVHLRAFSALVEAHLRRYEDISPAVLYNALLSADARAVCEHLTSEGQTLHPDTRKIFAFLNSAIALLDSEDLAAMAEFLRYKGGKGTTSDPIDGKLARWDPFKLQEYRRDIKEFPLAFEVYRGPVHLGSITIHEVNENHTAPTPSPVLYQAHASAQYGQDIRAHHSLQGAWAALKVMLDEGIALARGL